MPRGSGQPNRKHNVVEPLTENAPDPLQRVTLWDSSWSSRFVVLVLASMALIRIWSTVWIQFTPTAVNWCVLLLAPIVLYLVLPLVMRKPRSGRLQRPSLKSVAIELLIAFPSTILTLLAVTAYTTLFERYAPGSPMGSGTMERMMRSDGNAFLYLSLFLLVVLGPVCEEVFFRGFLYNFFRHRMNFFIAILLQAVIFGISHSYPAVGVGAVTLKGVFAGLVYHWRRTILAPIFLHACFNGLLALQVVVAVQTNADMAVVGIKPDSNTQGCVIASVEEHSPAAESGLEAGDIIMQFGEYSILNHEHLYSAVRLHEPGDVVTVVYERNGNGWEVEVKLISRREMANRREHAE